MTCADCLRALVPPCVSVAMRPGVDRQPWRLCVPCWLSSTKNQPLLPMRGRR